MPDPPVSCLTSEVAESSASRPRTYGSSSRPTSHLGSPPLFHLAPSRLVLFLPSHKHKLASRRSRHGLVRREYVLHVYM